MKAEPWAIDLVGKPWVLGARGPDQFDCWGLLCHVYKTQLGIELPTLPFDVSDLTAVVRAIAMGTEGGSDWERVKTPHHLAAVAMSTNKVFHHVGLWLDFDGGLVLHALDRQNVIAQPVGSLNRLGVRRVEYFRHKLHLP